MRAFSTAILASAVLIAGCEREPITIFGPKGERGEVGADGAPGPMGEPGADAESDARSGSRLKRQFRTAEDGARHFDAFFDPETGMPCRWFFFPDGDERCLPSDPRSVPVAVRFTDAECTKAVAQIKADACGSLPPFVTYQNYGDCSPRVRPLGPSTPPPDGSLFWIAPSSGVPACLTTPTFPDYVFYELGEERAPDDFVAGTFTIE